MPEPRYQGPPTPRAGSTAPGGTVPPPPPAQETVTITINGREVQAQKGASLLHTCLDNGAPVPYFCDHRKLDPIGACRMCVVAIEKQPKLATACTITVQDGMAVSTESADVLKAREGVLEFLLINHPLDCPVCDKGGECDLQDFSFYHGPGKSRFIEEKIKYPKPVPLSDRILLDMERCVLCERCVRFFDEITEEGELVLLNRGVHTMIGTFDGRPLTSNFQGNIMEVCPVGALTSADWRFSARPWDMRSTPSICHGCAVGCNVQVQSRDDRLVRYMGRDNPVVNDGWLCDRGRYGFHFVHDSGRILTPTVRRADGLHGVTYPEAIAEVAARLQEVVRKAGPQSVGVIVSPEATNEELFLLQRWAREVVGTTNIDHRIDLASRVPEVDDFRLGIEDFPLCQAIYILGDQPTLDLGPILELGLKKARRHARTRLVLEEGRKSEELAAELPEGARLAGIIAPESMAVDASVLQSRLEAHGVEVRRLLVLAHANSRGAADMGCLPELGPGYVKVTGRPGLGTWEMLEAAAAGRLKALCLFGPGALAGIETNPMLARALAAVELVVCGEALAGAVSRAAHVLLPTHTFAEKDGTYTNLEGRIQRLRQAIPPVARTPPDWRLAQDLANAWEAGWSYRQPADVMRDIVAAVPAYGIDRAGQRAGWRSA